MPPRRRTTTFRRDVHDCSETTAAVTEVPYHRNDERDRVANEIYGYKRSASRSRSPDSTKDAVHKDQKFIAFEVKKWPLYRNKLPKANSFVVGRFLSESPGAGIDK